MGHSKLSFARRWSIFKHYVEEVFATYLSEGALSETEPDDSVGGH